MPAASEHTAHETLTFDGEPLKALAEPIDGKARVGAYAVRFSGPDEKDLQGDYFTKATNFGRENGDGAPVLFHHGMPCGKGGIFDALQDGEYGPAKAMRDEVGIFVETCLDLSDREQKALYEACQKGALRWSSGSASHMARKAQDGRITRWPIVEFSLTPTPVEPRLPAIRPMKALDLTAPEAAALAEVFGGTAVPQEPPAVDNAKANAAATKSQPAISFPTMTPEELAAQKAAADKAQKEAIDSAVKARELAIDEISAIGEQFNCREDATKAIRDSVTPDDFRKHVLQNVLKAKPVDFNANLIGMDQKDLNRYSFLKACREMTTRAGLTGLEKEAHQAALKACGRDIDSKAFIIPDDVYRGGRFLKAQNVTTATAGGFTVQNTIGPIIELLRNKMRVVEAGATLLGGLQGNVILPVHVSGSTAYWVSETGALTDSQSVFGQKTLTPHRLGSTIPYSTQFLAQSSIDAESFIRNDAATVLAIEKDRAALLGSGVEGQPLGVANTTGINATVTYSNAATWADVVEHETGIADDNADFDVMAFILGPTTVGKWKTILRDSVAGAKYLIDDDMTANGYRVFRSKQVGSAAQSFFGAWSQLILASWAGLEVIVDPYALKKSGQVEITFNELVDNLVRQPLAFNVSTDSAAQ